MNRSPSERLKAAREKRYETATDAAKAHGWNVVTYRSHESGTRNYGLSTARIYAQAFGTTAAKLLGLSNHNGVDASVFHSVTYVPLVAVASAGAFRVDEGIREGVQVPAVPHASVAAEVQYAILVDGPSVNKRIADGAFAICAPYDHYPGGPKHGQLVHVVRERAGLHEHTIKELHYTRKGPVLMPCSTDPKYQEQIALDAPEDDVTVRLQGVVIGVFQVL